MLTAHSNTKVEDFIAQLRTYVIAMGMGPQVVDCVDSLADGDAIETRLTLELQECEDQTKNKILKAVEAWAAAISLNEETTEDLLSVIRDTY